MAEDNFTLTTFYTSWKAFQDEIKRAIAPLTAEQLALRATPDLRSIGENVLHIVGCRAFWFAEFLGEDGGEGMQVYVGWNEAALKLGALIPSAAELAEGLDRTWQFMADCLSRWSPDEMRQTFPDDWDGQRIDLSRAWVVWHVMEHDLFHGGELSLLLGMHTIPAGFTGYRRESIDRERRDYAPGYADANCRLPGRTLAVTLVGLLHRNNHSQALGANPPSLMEAPRLVAAPLMADKSGPTGLVELANAPLKEEGKGCFL